MSVSFKLYEDAHHNCFNVTVAAMLKRLGLDEQLAFHQTGLTFEFAAEPDCGYKLSPYYKDMYGWIESHLGTAYLCNKIEDIDEAVRIIRRLIREGKTAAVSADVFSLPYSHYYLKNHDPHMFEIVGYSEERAAYEICDHYYHYNGWLDESLLIQILRQTREAFRYKQVWIHSFERTGKRTTPVDTEQALRIISDNNEKMKGSSSPEQRRNRSVYSGVEAIGLLERYFPRLFSLDKELAEPLMDQLYKDLRETGDSRYHYHRFLTRFAVKELAEATLIAAQHWTVIANLSLRALLNGRTESLLTRIETRLGQVYEQESRNIEWTDGFLLRKASNEAAEG